jgi:GntR family transcriptional regulator
LKRGQTAHERHENNFQKPLGSERKGESVSGKCAQAASLRVIEGIREGYGTVYCTMCNNTVVIPFRLSFEPGISLYEQVVYAAKKAVISGRMCAGDPFPSVRELSKALKINPNTAHKVVTQLVAEGLLEVHSGIGTVVAKRAASTANDRGNLLNNELEHLVVEAKKLGLNLEDVTTAVGEHWRRLDGTKHE